jgi:UDP-glucuronate 4-epimerase
VHLAAQPGVRHSLIAPEAYVRNNLVAFGHVLEGCRHAGVAPSVYASSSSVYGANHVAAFFRGSSRSTIRSASTRRRKGQRADGAQLQPPVPDAGDRIALLHRLWPVGPSRPGADAVHSRDPRGQSDRRVQRQAGCGATSRT